MALRWKLLGLAGAAGVAATGLVVVRRRRATREDLTPEELRERLHRRLAEAQSPPPGGSTQPPVSPL